MVVGVHRRAVGVFSHRQEVENALQELRSTGFPMDRVSVIKRDADRKDEIAGAEVRENVGNKADEGATAGAVSGGVLGGLTGLLVGLGTLAIPGIGPIMLAGATATALATTLAGAGIGAATGGIVGALIGLGIPEERARVYNERLERGDYLVIIDGTDAEIAKARDILTHRGVQEFAVYDRPEHKQGVVNPVAATPVGVGTTPTIHRRRAIGVFPNRRDAEVALTELRDAGLPLSQVSLIAKDGNHYNNVTGTLATTAAGRVTGGLVGLIPENRTTVYNDRLTRGDYLIIVDGTEDEVRRAEAIFKRHGIQEFDTFDAAETTGVHRHDSDRGIHPVVGTTPTTRRRRAIGVFPNRRDAEVALTELRDAGFPLSQVSLIAKDGNHNTNLTGTNVGKGNKADEGAKAGAVTGGALGGLGGLLVGLGALAIPGIGPVIAGGAVATALATTAAGAGIGAAAGGVTGGLVGLGIPENRAKVYNDRLNRGDYLIIVDGTEDEIHRAEAILKRHGIQEFDTFDAADTTGVRRDSDRDIHPVIGTTPTTHRRRRAVGVFPNRRDAEVALTELRDAGFPLSQVSLIAKDGNHNTNLTDTKVGKGNKADEGAKAGAVTGGALGGLGGLLVGLGALAIPGIGPVIAGGAVATALATTAAGAGIGAAAGGVTGGLVGLGIPENRAKVYNDRLNRGDYLIIVDGTEDEIHHAEAILKRHGIQEFDTFDAADTTGVRRDSDRDIHPVIGTTPTTHRRRRAIGVFPNRRDAEVALTELRDAGFPLSQVSLIAKDGNHYNNVTGTLATTSAGRVTGGLVGLIPENRTTVYNDRLNRSDYLIIVDGTEDEVRRAEAILKRHGIQEFDTFDAADTTGVHRHDSDRGIHPVVGTTPTTYRRRAIGVFPNRRDAEVALTELRDAGLPLSQVSLIAKDGNHYTNVSGTLATTAAGRVTGGLVGLIPENRTTVYNDRLNRSDDLIIVDGTEDEVRRAEAILKRHGIQEFDTFDAADTTGVRRDSDRDIRHEAPVVNTTTTEHGVGYDKDDPAVIIVDHRNDRV